MPRDARFWLPVPPWSGPDPAVETRVSQTVGLVFTIPLPDLRVSQTVALVFVSPIPLAWTVEDNQQLQSTRPVWYDPTTDGAFGQPPSVSIFDPAAGFPWTVTEGQQLRSTQAVWYDPTTDGTLGLVPPTDQSLLGGPWTQGDDPQQLRSTQPFWYDPTDQAWHIGPPSNVVSLSAWTVEDHLPDQTVWDYDGQDGALGEITPTDPALLGGLWQGDDGQQVSSRQPTWNDPTTDGTVGLVPPTDQSLLGGVWNLDAQQERSTEPRWYDSTTDGYPGLVPPLAAFDPALGYPWIEDGHYVLAGSTLDPTDQAWAVGPPSNVVSLSTWTVEDHFPDATIRTYDPTDQPWGIGSPLNADRLSTFIDPQADPAPPPAYDPSEQAWGVQPPAAAAFDPSTGFPWAVEGHLPDQTPRWYDTQDAALGLIPPTDASLLGGVWTSDDVQQTRSTQSVWNDPTTDAALGLVPPTDPAALGALWQGPDGLGDQTVRAYDVTTDQTVGLVPPTDPAVLGELWQGDDTQQDRDLTVTRYDGQDAAFGEPPLGVAPFDPSTGFPWTTDEPLVAQKPTYDPTEIALGLVPPTDQALLAGLENGADSQQDRSTQPVWWDGQDSALGLVPPTDPSLLGELWQGPDGFGDQTIRWWDGTDGAFGGPPLPSVVFDPSAGFPWTVGDPSQDRSQQPVWIDLQDAALGLVPPTDAALLGGLWNGSDQQQDRDLSIVRYDGQDAAFGQPLDIFDPSAGFPWPVDVQQDNSIQPVWTDGQHGSPAFVPPTDASLLVWNLDSQQDQSTQPLWYDPTDQSYAIGPTLSIASLAALWNNADPQQDRSLQPVWYEPETIPPWTLTIPALITGGLPPGASAVSLVPFASAVASLPAATADHSTPAASATHSTPER